MIEDIDAVQDVDAILQELRRLSAQKGETEEYYQKLRDKAVELLGDDARIIVDPVTGEKQIANVVQQEVLKVNLPKLRELVDAEVYESVVKDAVDRTKFERAVQTGKIPGDVVERVAHYEPKTAFIGFNEPK